MKLFLILILFSIFILFAIFVYKYFLYRYRFFKDINYIISQIKNNISFNKDAINKILSDVSQDICNSTIKILKTDNTIWYRILNSKERDSVGKFFVSIGRGDIDFELGNLEYYHNIFDTYEKSAKEKYDKYALMYFKLIIGFGIILCIILI